ncbi:MAG: TlpA disulfide reductase family protein [Bacteroidota bacterium]|nr:TlpA disulfide reductase family protein [Bacteroidota bacterium]
MKPLLFFIAVFFVMNAFGQQDVVPTAAVLNIDSILRAQEAQAIGKQLDSFTAYYQGKKFTNKNLVGKTVFINFWNTTCAPCMAELTELNHLYDTLKSHKNFEFISFTFDPPNVVERTRKKYGITYKVFSVTIADCGRLSRNMGYPVSMIVDRLGHIQFCKTGGSMDKEEIRHRIFTTYYPQIVSIL